MQRVLALAGHDLHKDRHGCAARILAQDFVHVVEVRLDEPGLILAPFLQSRYHVLLAFSSPRVEHAGLHIQPALLRDVEALVEDSPVSFKHALLFPC